MMGMGGELRGHPPCVEPPLAAGRTKSEKRFSAGVAWREHFQKSVLPKKEGVFPPPKGENSPQQWLPQKGDLYPPYPLFEKIAPNHFNGLKTNSWDPQDPPSFLQRPSK